MNFKEWLNYSQVDEDTSISECLGSLLNENKNTTRYSIEINFLTKKDEAIDGFARMVLGYISAAMKKQGYHVKKVLDEKPFRIIISSRNWDDGEWTGLVSYNSDSGCFMISKGFFNRDRGTVSVQNTKTCSGDSANQITKELLGMMRKIARHPDRHFAKLKPVHQKRGPKK